MKNRFIQSCRYGALAGLCLVVVSGIADQGGRTGCSNYAPFWTTMKKVWVEFSSEKDESLIIAAWIAQSPEQRARGFQGVCPSWVIERSLLFSFPVAVRAKFHMTGVTVPLDIAFIDASKQVIDVQHMSRQKLNRPTRYYRSNSEIHFALETIAGGLDQLRSNPSLWRMRISIRN